MDYQSYARRLGEATDAGQRSEIMREMTQESIYMNSGREFVPPDRHATPEPDRNPVQLMLSDEEWKMLDELFNARIEHHRHYIKRAELHPSETVRSSATIDRHYAEIGKWERIQKQLHENVW